ncbi:hypothetical protein JCGZ_00820 [Jatropha curcas]|uniref:Bifunctional inhibitor/plant lipid transfer protein/seed storage helical domain-containing protein n=1 Tax=Jatropha curcas TaxID=180498 RepID=A0A067KVN8_JATCU|nr:2S albumin [Jatropha curcas]KDP39063.1 hypothetical protein JCGZ_00820 [Jatropha curcas]
MEKLTTSAALLCILLVHIANAVSGYVTTTITTVEIDDDSSNTSQRKCRREAERADLSSCESYMRSSRRPSEEMLALRGIENQQQRDLRQCCNELRQLSHDCPCEGIKYVLEQQLEQGQRERLEAVRRARSIPSACGLRTSCDIRS